MQARREAVVALAALLAACWTEQATVRPTSPSVPATKATTTPATWRTGEPRVVRAQPCATTAPFTVQGLNSTTIPTNICAAFERAWSELPPTSIAPGTFVVEIELREASVREATGLVQCDVTLAILTHSVPKGQGATRARTSEECVYQVLAGDLLFGVGRMEMLSKPSP